MSLFFIISIFILALGFLSLAISASSFAPWFPTRKQDVLRALELAQLKNGQTIYDLGCGTGTVLIQAVKNYSVKAIGFERAWPLYLICLIRKKLGGFEDNLKFKMGDFFKQDISQADIVYIFGMPSAIANKLKPKMERELKSGTKIISYVFPVEGWRPEKIDLKTDRSPIYLYINK